MIVLTVTLVVVGILPAFMSAFTGLLFWKHGAGWTESPSPLFVPFLGPLSLTLAILLNDLSLWLIPIAWVTDLGTLVVLWSLPAIIRQEWKTSRYTCVLRLKGSEENAHAVLTFHSSGKYLLRKRWVRPKGEEGIVGMGELGTYVEAVDGFTLRSDEQVDRSVVREGVVFRIDRKLLRTEGGYWADEETDLPERWSYHTLRNWPLRE